MEEKEWYWDAFKNACHTTRVSHYMGVRLTV